MIYLQPHSGLANRIRVIVSALSFAEQVNQDLIIYWSKDSGLNCDFFQLYCIHNKLDVRSLDAKVRILDRVKNKGILKFIFYKFYKIDFSLFDDDFRKFVWNSNTDYIDMSLIPKKATNYYIKACNEFSFNPAYLKYFTPVKNVQDIIDKVILGFPAKIIGVHIRRTDNDTSIEESPLKLFIEKIKSDLAIDSDVHYFLATDDSVVETDLLELFPSRILRSQKVFTRDSKEGIIGAMVDMYCLAATKKIYGSYWSSFSSLAARIGNIPLMIIKK